MNVLLKSAIFMSGSLLTVSGAAAQSKPAPPPPAPSATPVPPPPPGIQGRGMEKPQPVAGLQQLTSLTGKITGYISNDCYEYDGLTLQSSGGDVTVKFPPHLGAQMMKTAPKGSAINISGFYERTPSGGNEFRMVQATAGNAAITDTPPALPPVPRAQQQGSFSGTISGFNRNPDGILNGIVLAGKEVIELPPPAAEQLQGLLKAGEKISGTGMKMEVPAGVVMAREVNRIQPQTITVNGQTYMVR